MKCGRCGFDPITQEMKITLILERGEPGTSEYVMAKSMTNIVGFSEDENMFLHDVLLPLYRQMKRMWKP